jgi:hypothetical protein
MRRPQLALVLAALVCVSVLAWMVMRPLQAPGDQGAAQPASATREATASPAPELARPDPVARADAPSKEPDVEPQRIEPLALRPRPTPQFQTRAWEEYQAMTAADVQREYAELHSQLSDLTQPLLQERFRAGLGVSTGKRTHTVDSSDVENIRSYVYTEDDRYRVELPRAEYSDLYAVKDLTVRLQKLAEEKRAAEVGPR